MQNNKKEQEARHIQSVTVKINIYIFYPSYHYDSIIFVRWNISNLIITSSKLDLFERVFFLFFYEVHVVQALEEQAGWHSAHNSPAFTRRHTPSRFNTSSAFGCPVSGRSSEPGEGGIRGREADVGGSDPSIPVMSLPNTSNRCSCG